MEQKKLNVFLKFQKFQWVLPFLKHSEKGAGREEYIVLFLGEK